MRGIEEISLDGLKDDLTRSRRWTARFVRQFEDKEMDLRPGEGSMPTRDQVKQIRQSDELMVSLLTDAVPNPALMKTEFNCDTVALCLAALKEGLDKVLAAVEKATPELLLEQVEPFGPEWRMTRGQLLYLMMDHESHHRGQIAVYLRVAGKKPAVIWEPMDDKVFDL